MRELSHSELRAKPSSTLSVIVVDDERLARSELIFLLKEHADIDIVAEGRNGAEALQLIREHRPDLMFLDVAMPGQTGIEVVARLLDKRKKGKIPHIIFATAFDQYAFRAFELNAIDYLLKPVEKDRLARSLDRVRQSMDAAVSPAETLEALVRTLETRQSQPSRILLRSRNRLLMIDAKDLICARVQEGRILLMTRDQEGESNFRTIEELHGSLGEERFWRPHRSYLVNLDHIQEVIPWFKSTYQLRMADRKQTEIPVSRAQTKRLRELFHL